MLTASPPNSEQLVEGFDGVDLLLPDVGKGWRDDILLNQRRYPSEKIVEWEYKAFYVDNDHFKEKSSGSTTTHVDFSQYDSFIFDLSNDQFPPTDRSNFYHEEFADGLAHIISPPEYDRFCFKIEPELGNLTMDVVGIFLHRKRTRVHDCPDCEDSQFCHSSRVSHPQLHLGIRYPNLID
ncbi:hypothetical protein Tco_1020185 [Tanacetum coccineum]|uniref:Uncharacterized protein n=1 Tax=Tanacetum coccineum TaxID=301880 RepID=A0ABQ5FZB4_9ASTR